MSYKQYLDENVYDATMQRLDILFHDFDHLVVSFSGGKDSGVMLNLALQYANRHHMLNKLAVYHMDYEAQYQATTDYVATTMHSLPKEVKQYWFCLPIKAQCSTSMFQNSWTPWDKAKQDIWVRRMPKGVINEDNFDLGFDYHCWDYTFNERFDKYLASQDKTAFLIGIRAQESLQRYKAVTKHGDRHEYKGLNWTTSTGNGSYNAYPMYDWTTDDIWVANAKFGFKYNHIYDLMYEAGVNINDMRVASPFNDAATSTLQLYKVLDPNTWYKMIGRVNGVNFTSIYGKTHAMGWNGIKKPAQFTWKQYAEFLLSTLDETTRNNYLRKIDTSIKYWTKEGGALPKDIINQLPNDLDYDNLGKPNGNRHYSKPYEVLKFKHYLDDVDSKSPNLLPTYKRICIAIMKNDTSMKTLGFGQTKSELEKRKKAMQKYQNIF